MSFPRYPEYKDSRSQWLGQVPEHWSVQRARTMGSFTASGIDKKMTAGETRAKMFNYLDVYQSTDKTLRFSADLMDTTAPPEKIEQHSVRGGDILLTPSSETADDIGHAARVLEVPSGVVYSYHLLRFRPLSTASAAFLTYCFNSAPMRAYFSSVCTGTTRMVLVRDDFKNAPLAIPPIAEQAAISAFLDRETAKLDALVSEQRRLISLLKDKRQAVISRAVTKGLNEFAQMKPSNIDWLGEVPSHWDIRRLKHVSPEITVGIVVEPSKYYVAEGVPALRSLNVMTGAVTLDNLVFLSPESNELHAKSKLRVGDLVSVRSGQPGTTAVIPPHLDGCNCVDLIVIRKPSVGSEWFLCWYLASDAAITQFEIGSGGAIQQHFNVSTAMDLVVAIPPPEEQLSIVAFINTHTSRIDALIADTQRAIDLLHERRTALIAAAVTGKIDVRGQVAFEAA